MATTERLAKYQRIVANRQRDIVVILENINDPHNAAAIFRSCDAFGIQHVHLINETVPNWEPEIDARKTAAFTNKWLNFYQHPSAEACIEPLKQQGYEIHATLLADDAQALYNVDYSSDKKIALLLGNEREGLSMKALTMADKKIIIPMQGFAQSFNVSVTAALMMGEISRQRKLSSVDFSLSPESQEFLLSDYLQR